MSPSQESVDKYLHDNFPPNELEKYRADLRAQVEALPAVGYLAAVWRADVLALFDGSSE